MSKLAAIIIAVIGLLVVFFLGMSSIVYGETAKLQERLHNEVKIDLDFDNFVAYQVKLFKSLERTENNGFVSETYWIVTEYEGELSHQLITFTVPNGAILRASSKEDPNDLTQFIFKNSSNEILLDTKVHESYKNLALSFNYNQGQLGFIYQFIVLEESDLISIEVKDYEGDTFVSLVLDIDLDNFDESDFELGWTTEDLEREMNIKPILTEGLMFYIGIYLGVVALLFGGYYTYKAIQRSKIK